MATLTAVVEAHAPVLVLDAASSVIQAGVLDAARSWRGATSTEEAGVAVFALVEKLGRSPDDFGAFVFCDGPGSILGIRTVAMALRAWCVLRPRPCFAYTSLALIINSLSDSDTSVIADARRDSWHWFRREHGLQRVAASALSGKLVTPEPFRHWAPLPPGVTTVPYSLAELLPGAWDADLFTPTAAPDAFLHEEPSYVAWSPQIHRAPGERGA